MVVVFHFAAKNHETETTINLFSGSVVEVKEDSSLSIFYGKDTSFNAVSLLCHRVNYKLHKIKY